MQQKTVIQTIPGFLFLVLAVWACSGQSLESTRQWYKGNLHTHSLWSDGDDYPEVVTRWYKQQGYHFLAISDHNTLHDGEKWITVDSTGYEQYLHYWQLFGEQWVEVHPVTDTLSGGDAELWRVRLKTLAEYRPIFEEPGKFLLIQAEELTDRFERKPLHINATNIQHHIPPQHGNSVIEVLQNNVDAIRAQRESTGEPILPHINHPNFGYAISPEELAQIEGDNFFEVYNGHPLVHNAGDETHASTDELWDYILTRRLLNGGSIMYGLAVDDAHHYSGFNSRAANPGRGWIMVHAAELSAENLIAALEVGDFYASTGVSLDSIHHSEKTYGFSIKPEPEVIYTTQFIVTLRDRPEEHGVVRFSATGQHPVYTIRGDELYVRAKVISSKPKADPGTPGEKECAWVQPVLVNNPAAQ
ncbi:MAG: histidinol-phosphatase [Lentisphaeria bacterium]|nr:histidinol-phosphatase [Candidatus Neomarinimicrobiota bacterium]MCF7842618.1 histidinol-phosphatase [Lentisphaeria bacterium]